LVKDGDTIVIGGIYTKDFTERVTKIPILGDIPWLGWMFKSSSKIDEITELMIFITPRIVKERTFK
jgi:type IV pilus assembly protein PilQ